MKNFCHRILTSAAKNQNSSVRVSRRIIGDGNRQRFNQREHLLNLPGITLEGKLANYLFEPCPSETVLKHFFNMYSDVSCPFPGKKSLHLLYKKTS